MVRTKLSGAGGEVTESATQAMVAPLLGRVLLGGSHIF
jgi:hypothetical protein